MDWKIELIFVPVTDVDRAKDFYEKVGFRRVGARRFMVAGTPEEDNVRLTAL